MCRAVKTLLVYLMETNQNLYHWLVLYLQQNPIPRSGTWVSALPTHPTLHAMPLPRPQQLLPACSAATYWPTHSIPGLSRACCAPLLSAPHPFPTPHLPQDEVSGEVFLRKLLLSPIESASYAPGSVAAVSAMHRQQGGGAPLMAVDPRHMAQRIMDIRAVLAKEFVQDLGMVGEENNELLRETLTSSLNSMLTAMVDTSAGPGALGGQQEGGFVHPELLPPDMMEEGMAAKAQAAKAVQEQEQEAKAEAQKKQGM